MLIGVVLMVLAVWLYRSAAVPADAVVVPATVVGHERRRIGTNGPRTLVGAVVEYDHPGSGKHERMEPRSFSTRPPAIGERVQLADVPASDRIRLIDAAQRRRSLLVVGGFGVTMAVVQVLSWSR